MSTPSVIALCLIYSGNKIVYQGSFQVFEEENEHTATLRGGGELSIRHSYQDTQCEIHLTYLKEQLVKAQVSLEVPINRTKTKWKQAFLGEDFVVYHRCAFEDGDSPQMSKQLRKMKRKSAITSANHKPNAAIIYVGGEDAKEGA